MNTSVAARPSITACGAHHGARSRVPHRPRLVLTSTIVGMPPSAHTWVNFSSANTADVPAVNFRRGPARRQD